ncbi:MAG: helix-turn-helix domain-containing protein [Alphaproteobacteria bacterium]|nr:helix-turn-helix domain-containing protein [Alphaproteobacteria bacterium]
MGQQSSVRALERGLDIIQLLNRHNGLTVTQVGQLTDLPRPTAFRLLRTLESLGFLFRDKQDKKYRLTLQVRTLSHGYDQEEWIPKVARPIMVELCKKILWPLALGTINGAHILVRETTDEISPFAIRRHRGGLQIPLLSTASGSAYLAFSDPHKREELIEFAMAEDQDALSRGGSNIELYRRSLEAVRTDGYACMRVVGPDHNALAFPVIVNGEIFATISARFYTSAMTLQQAVERYAEDMRETAQRMGQEIGAWKEKLPDAA